MARIDTHDVILAVATPPGRAARGIVRASGPRAFGLVERTGRFEALGDGRGGAVRNDGSAWPRGVYRGRVRAAGAEVPAIALAFPAPRSYTGDDTVEILLPGAPPLLDAVIDALIDAGGRAGVAVRRAEPGEYTARAYMSGRMSLAEAEGVAARIAARSDAELRAADMLASGRLRGTGRTLGDDIAGALALVEAGIDFTDQEDVVPITPAALEKVLRDAAGTVDAVLTKAVPTEQLEALPWAVLGGCANAGKSTLFNALLGRERAVVSGRAGTTRDVLAEPLEIATATGPAEIMLADVAGEAEGDGALDRAMRSAARVALGRAELVLWCVPVEKEGAGPTDGRVIVVRTKGDLMPAGSGDGTDTDTHTDACPSITVSARTGAGLPELRAAIAARLSGRAVSLAADTLVLIPRHEAALRTARSCIDRALDLLEHHGVDAPALAEPELVAACLRDALDGLGPLTGDVSPDDVLGLVFARFCVGK